MWENLKNWILSLFGKQVFESDDEVRRSASDARKYADTSSENITAVISNSLATLAFADGSVNITGENKRAEYLNEMVGELWKTVKQSVSSCLGVGMIASIPYSVDTGIGRKIYVDTVTKERFFITGKQGADITQCTVLSDVVTNNHHKYTRWTDYSVEHSTYVIRQRAMRDETPCALAEIARWADISEEIRIAGVERLPIGIMYCPANSRNPGRNGVPITFGCDATLSKITKTLSDIECEFKNKKTKILVDRSLVKDNEIDKELYIALTNSDKLAVDFFDPAFRESAYYTKLQNHFALLEKEVGCSRGVLTELSVEGATATAIRRAMLSTFSLCDDIHTQFEAYLESLVYGIDVLCNYYGITPPGEYGISYDWSYALLEDSETTFNQLERGKALGAVDVAEVRHFIFPDETLDESAEKCAEIKKNNPTMSQLIGE